MKQSSKIALTLLGLIVVSLLLLQTPLLQHVRSAAWSGWTKTIARVFHLGHLELSHDVDQQLQQLLAENIRLKSEAADYAALKEQLGSPAFASYRAISAQVEARTLDTFQTKFVVNQGAVDGVTVGAPVVINGSILVGFITEAFEHTAFFQSLLHPSTNLSVEIRSDEAPRGLLVGRQFTSMAVTTIPRDAPLQTGQEVVTVARENVPAGLLVGRINAINSQEHEAYQEALVAIPYDLDRLRAVNILVLP